MKQYTSPEQTLKLIELGFEKPKAYMEDDIPFEIRLRPAYTIGELIGILPEEINDGLQSRLEVYIDHNKMWAVTYNNILGGLCSTYHTELIDALYDMIIKLKEEGMI